MLQTALDIHDPNAYERAMNAGPSEFGREVADGINSSATQLMGMAFDIHWLAEVLPSLALGDATLYETTGPPMRSEQKQALVTMDMLLGLPDNAYMVANLQSQMRNIEATAERNVLITVAMLR